MRQNLTLEIHILWQMIKNKNGEVITCNVRVKAVFDGERGVRGKGGRVVSMSYFFFDLSTCYVSVCL